MKKFGLIAVLLAISTPVLADGFAGHVVSYNAGASPSSRYYFDSSWNFVGTDPLTMPVVALGKPSGLVVDPYVDDMIVSAFNPAANRHQIVSIGEGGSLTLRLENYVVIGAGADIGLFTNVGLGDDAWPGGQTATPATTFGADEVTVDVSYNGSDWTSLGSIMPNLPTNAWTDAAGPYATSATGLTESDYSNPFTGTLSDFDGKTFAEINTLLNGSAGGFWLDLSSTGLTEIGYIRFTVPDDGEENVFPLNFELDAVSIASGHVGASLPEPCTMGMLALAGVSLLRRRRK